MGQEFRGAHAVVSIGDRQIDEARIAEVCERYGISELAVFGSIARGDADPDSDIDLLFELAPDARLGFGLFDLERELAQLFARRVDLLCKDSIHRLLEADILSEARVIYAA